MTLQSHYPVRPLHLGPKPDPDSPDPEDVPDGPDDPQEPDFPDEIWPDEDEPLPDEIPYDTPAEFRGSGIHP
jgi:hypothetical protein